MLAALRVWAIAVLAFAGAVATVVGAPKSDDERFQMIMQCHPDEAASDANGVIQYNKALAAGALSDNPRDVQDAYIAIGGCYGDIAGRLITALPLPCQGYSASCLARIEAATESRAYNCANKSAIKLVVNALSEEVRWYQRADAMGSEPGTRNLIESAQKDLTFYQKYACHG